MIFANPLFLWGLLALAIPVAVHLFQFRRYKKVYFSNVDRLSELRSESRRQSELRRWLVLLMRCLAIIFLVLAFAQPTLPGKGQSLHSGATVISVYLDNSFSMENSSSDGNQLEMAKEKAREIVSAYRQGDRYQLLSNTMSGDEFRWLSREEFLDAVDALSIAPASRRISEVVTRQRDFMCQSGAANRHAYLVSDFQRSAANLAALPSDSLIHFTFVPLEGVATDNIYIDTLRLNAPAYFVGGSVTVEAAVYNGGSVDVEKIPIRLIVNGRERALATLDIPAGSSAKAVMRFTIDSAGWLDGRVELTDYPITFDDHYYFTLLAGSRINVLQVDGGAPNENLQKLFSDDSSVMYRQGPLPSDLSDFNFIVLNEPRELSSGHVQALSVWVEQGGSLLLIPPADGKTESLNTLLSLVQAPRLDRWVKQPVKASMIDIHCSLYRGVFNGSSDEMEMPLVQGHYSTNSQGAVRQNIITLADGTSLLSLTPYGDGRLYLVTTPLTVEWTDFVSQALFVPTLYNMALYSRPQLDVAHVLGDDNPIFLQGSYNPSGTPQALIEPHSRFSILPDIRRQGNRNILLPHGELNADGIYFLGDNEHLAFNYSRQESQLDFLSRSEIEDLLAGRQGYTLVRNAAKPLDQEIRSREGGTSLWRWCLLIALAALLTETILLRLCSFKSKK